MVNSPLIRPYFLGVNVALGGVPVDSHDFFLQETHGLHGKAEFSFSGQHTHRHFLTNTYLLGDFIHTTLLDVGPLGRLGPLVVSTHLKNMLVKLDHFPK